MNALLLHDQLDSATERFGDRVAVRSGAKAYTFTALTDISHRVAAALLERGLGPGDRVCVSVHADADAVVASLALGRIGAVLVPMNANAPEVDRKAIVAMTEPALVVGSDPDAAMTLSELVALRGKQDRCAIEVDERATHIMYFTSGTTGTPKGVEISHRADYLRALAIGTPVPRGPFVCMFPQFHMAGWSLAQGCWASGEEVVYVDGGDTRALLEALAAHRAHRIYAIPAVLRRMLDADRSQLDLSALQVIDTGTSATSPELLAEVAAQFPGTETSVAYGSSEAGAVCMLRPSEIADHPGSVGRAVPGVRVRISETGELEACSPFLFSRYYRNPEATARALVDGWYRTGEVAEQDADGYVRIVGRVHDIIRSGGESVPPTAVDRVLADHPAIADVAVAGVPDEYWGEIVTAFVVLKPGSQLDLDGLRGHCAARLAAPQQPRRLEFVDAIPRSAATGQIQRHMLVKALAAGTG
ncbi:MAG TPA: AMP-binding protein [Mycobacteriales bacterium]|jgi:acyl-CoA synthetase (AMP-forming)/AMP-acid ligase II|nr:AMP-binding protein [Mycobacteriales bacterium]